MYKNRPTQGRFFLIRPFSFITFGEVILRLFFSIFKTTEKVILEKIMGILTVNEDSLGVLFRVCSVQKG